MSNIFSFNNARESEIFQNSKRFCGVHIVSSCRSAGCQKCNKRHNSKLYLEDEKGRSIREQCIKYMRNWKWLQDSGKHRG